MWRATAERSRTDAVGTGSALRCIWPALIVAQIASTDVVTFTFDACKGRFGTAAHCHGTFRSFLHVANKHTSRQKKVVIQLLYILPTSCFLTVPIACKFLINFYSLTTQSPKTSSKRKHENEDIAKNFQPFSHGVRALQMCDIARL